MKALSTVFKKLKQVLGNALNDTDQANCDNVALAVICCMYLSFSLIVFLISLSIVA